MKAYSGLYMGFPPDSVSDRFRVPGGVVIVLAAKDDDLTPYAFQATEEGLMAALEYVAARKAKDGEKPKDGHN